MKQILAACSILILSLSCGQFQSVDEPQPTEAVISVETEEVIPTLAPTSSNTPVPATPTENAVAVLETKAAAYQDITWEELIDNIEPHIGEQVKIYGKVALIENDLEFQINVVDINIALILESPSSELSIGDMVTVFGTVKELKCFTVTGNKVCYPILVDAFFIKD